MKPLRSRQPTKSAKSTASKEKYIDKWGTQRANTFIYIVQ